MRGRVAVLVKKYERGEGEELGWCVRGGGGVEENTC